VQHKLFELAVHNIHLIITWSFSESLKYELSTSILSLNVKSALLLKSHFDSWLLKIKYILRKVDQSVKLISFFKECSCKRFITLHYYESFFTLHQKFYMQIPNWVSLNFAFFLNILFYKYYSLLPMDSLGFSIEHWHLWANILSTSSSKFGSSKISIPFVPFVEYFWNTILATSHSEQLCCSIWTRGNADGNNNDRFLENK